MKIMYLTWGETPRSHGVFASQAIRQFVATKKQLPDDEFLFVSAVPLIHSGLIREKLSYFKELSKIRKLLGNINFEWLPIFSSQNFIYTSRWFFNWIFLGAFGPLKNIISRFEPDIVHCRSYLATWAAIKVRKKYRLNYRVVFDARGLHPEELSLKKSFSDRDPSYLFLKKIEKILLEESDVTIAVSDTMSDHFKYLNARNVETVYLSASFEKLSISYEKSASASGPINFCYVGALSESTWHQPSSLFKLFSRLKELFPSSVLTIVTKSNHDPIRKTFSSFSSNDVRIGSASSIGELKEHLNDADFGLMSYFEPETDREKMLADMVMAVKTAEYLCAGLPMIVNSYCGGAAGLIKKHGLGLAYDPDNLSKLTAEEILLFDRNHRDASKIAELARQLFDYESNAKKYADIYYSVLNLQRD